MSAPQDPNASHYPENPWSETTPPVVKASGRDEVLPEDLPPVEPPSAGFIVQLFLVPALIVLVLIGVWALFGKLAAGEQDWGKLLADLQSQNEHRRWRAAHGLAQLLQSDARLNENGQHLANNEQIAQGLADLLQTQLESRSSDDTEIKQQAYLAGALGHSDVREIVLPPLVKATQSEYDRDVRKIALASIALIAGRAWDRGEPLEANQDGVQSALISASHDEDELIRQMAAYALGLVPGNEATQQLQVMLDDPDLNTQVNAAVGLTRRESKDGLPVFKQVLKTAATPQGEKFPDLQGEPLESARFQDYLVTKNTLRALNNLNPLLTVEEREELTHLIEPVAEDYREQSIRLDATEVLRTLRQK